MLKPDDVIPHLARRELHWREGHSAHALATTWFRGNGLPRAVCALFASHDIFRDAELVDAILERKTNLRDGVVGQSQTDLLGILGVGLGLAILAVEGKVEESFGPYVSEWMDNTPARTRRLGVMTSLFGVSGHDVSTLRYQLFHRAASAIYEAQRYRASMAMLMVHSFSDKQSGWNDFAAFTLAISLTRDAKPNEILGPVRVGDINLYAAWLADGLPTSKT